MLGERVTDDDIFGDCCDFAAIAEDLVRKRGEDPDAPTKILEAPWLDIELDGPRPVPVLKSAPATKQVWSLKENYFSLAIIQGFPQKDTDGFFWK